ncbi:MAG TPA: hypothetical protein VK995_03340 [Oceanipulchritudo sp.]|nr:hypothetical protein [Oceanipulchritudo sp.]
MKDKRAAHLLGIGLDNKDGHKRLTRAEKFSVVGGSEETHERMTETLIKTFEDLKEKGKELEETETDELAEIIQRNTPG